MTDSLLNDWSNTKTYASEANLTKAIAKLGLDQYRPVTVRAPDGRWTAIFAKSFCGEQGSDFMIPIWQGFKVLG